MGSERLPLQNKGIFRNLPTFDDSIKDLTAIVTGANGISGFHTMRVLLESPQRWKKVWAASRRPPPEAMMKLLPQEQRDRVEHVALDFLSEPEEIAKVLRDKGVSADVVFFYSYAQPAPKPGAGAWSNAQELVDVNCKLVLPADQHGLSPPNRVRRANEIAAALLRNFLGALALANIEPSRFLLQTGAKNYGLHLGTTRTPHTESDPRVDHMEPNFYYPQEDILFKYCAKHHNTKWNIICPAWIIGAVNNAAMNALHPLAVYAAVQARKDEPLRFPGDITAWLSVPEHSSAKLTGYLSEWAALEDKCADQKFNASDGSPLPNNRLWPELARWYGCGEHTGPELDETKLTAVDPGDVPTPLGYGPPPKPRFAFTLTQWAREPENHEAWKEIMAKHELDDDPFDGNVEENFTYGDAAAWALSVMLSTNKARYFGWTGHVDTLESLFLAYGELNKIGMLPPLVVDKANPLI